MEEIIKYQLIAETIKHYGSKPEERSMADFILGLIGLAVEDAQSLTVAQLANVVANYYTRDDDTPLRPRGPGRKQKAIA